MSKQKLPYTMEDVMKVKAGLGNDHVNKSDLFRKALKMLPMTPQHAALATGLSRRYLASLASDMAERGYVRRLDDGRYEFVFSPPTRKQKIPTFTKKKNQPIVFSAKRDRGAWAGKDGETVEEFLARGGEIDRSPTDFKFERLTDAEIRANLGRPTSGHQMPTSPRTW